MNQFVAILLVGVFGALGALTRYATAMTLNKWLGEDFPWATLSVNVLGCFMLGFLAHLSDQYLSHQWKLILGVGFLGALTTFSTFGWQTVTHWQAGQAGIALLNIGGNILLGLTAVVLGMWLADSLFPAE